MQAFLKNDKFEILTLNGFVDFDGILVTSNQQTITINSETDSISCTKNHLLKNEDDWIEASKIKKNQFIKNSKDLNIKVKSISKNKKQNVYDLINVSSEDCNYITNDFISHNCGLVISDELGHVRKNIQEEMWASILPTLSTGGSCIIMSTPNGDNDLYAELYRGAEAGINGFVPIYVPLEEIPNYEIKGAFRDKKWQDNMQSKIGELRFRQEYNCIDYDTLITIRINKQIKQIKIGDLYELLYNEGEDEICLIQN